MNVLVARGDYQTLETDSLDKQQNITTFAKVLSASLGKLASWLSRIAGAGNPNLATVAGLARGINSLAHQHLGLRGGGAHTMRRGGTPSQPPL